MIKKAWKSICGINGLILAVYLFVILFSHAFVIKNSSLLYLGHSFFAVVAISLLVSILALRAGRKLTVRCDDAPLPRTGKCRWTLGVFLVTFLGFMVLYLIYYPGCNSPDIQEQYAQAISDQYNDWHPVLHTLFAYKLPLLLTGGWIGSIVLFQMLLFATVITYTVYTVRLYTNWKVAAAVLAFYLLNPSTGYIALFPWKDVSFAIGAMLSLVYTAKIYFTKGRWFRKPLNVVLYVIVLAFTTVFRHNAILFTIPLGIAAMFYIPNKRRIILLIGAAALVLGVKYPLYSALQVEQPGSRQIETLGLPINIIGSVVTYNPDALDDETREFAYKIATPEKWEQKYVYGNYNTLKWDKDTNNDIIEEYGAARVLKMAASCLIKSPREALTGLIRLTDSVYTITDDYPGFKLSNSASRACTIDFPGNKLVYKVSAVLATLAGLMFPHLFHYVGAMMLVLLFAVLAKCRLNKWRDIKKILLVLPVFAYNFGSMLLLTGRGDASRFFFYTFLLVPVYLVLFFRRENGEGGSLN